eukprot:scaffold11040_cov62-Phaeocystis_antarctica.AAC.2
MPCRAALAIFDVQRASAGRADASRGRQQYGLLRSEPQKARPTQAVSGEGKPRWQGSEPGHVRHPQGGGAVRRAVAGGACGCGEGCSSGATADERGGAAAGAGGGADAAARGREQDGLLWSASRQARPAQALSGAGEARWRESDPGQLRHRRGGRAVRCAVAGGARGGDGAGCSGGAADERGGAAAGTGGGADAACGQEQDGLLRRAPQRLQAQALPGASVARWQASEPGQLRHRRRGGAVRRAIAGRAGGGGKGGGGGETGHAPCRAVRRHPQGGGRGSAYAARRIRQGGGRGPAHAARRIRQGRSRRQARGEL